MSRKVVLKALKADRRDDAVALAQLHKEFALGFEVDSPAVCRTLAWHSVPGGVGSAIEMEYCEGRSLRQLLDEGRHFDAAEAEAITEALLRALADIHAAGIIHRDIKPANIMVDLDRQAVKVIDFGCADTADYVVLKSPAGTPRYTPPAKQAGCPAPAASDDLYALGVTLLELAEATDDKRQADTLRRFGRKLCGGQYASARQAAANYGRLRKGRGRLLLWVAPLGILLLAVALYLAWPRPAAEAEPAPAAVVVEAAASEPDDLEQYALTAGALLRASLAGTTTPHEEADAQVIRFADSLYQSDLRGELSGQKYDADSRRALADTYARRYLPELVARYPRLPDGYDPERRRTLLRARMVALLTTYHSQTPI